jgi:hypothetical protein
LNRKKKRVSNPEYRSIEIIQSEEKKGKRKISRISETCGTPSSIPNANNENPRKNVEREMDQKSFEEITEKIAGELNKVQ